VRPDLMRRGPAMSTPRREPGQRPQSLRDERHSVARHRSQRSTEFAGRVMLLHSVGRGGADAYVGTPGSSVKRFRAGNWC
jgi:hypothetical protein